MENTGKTKKIFSIQNKIKKELGLLDSADTQSCLTLCDPMDCSLLGSSGTGFSWQENWSGVPFPTPGDLPNPEIRPMSLMSPALAGGSFTTEPAQKSLLQIGFSKGCNAEN